MEPIEIVGLVASCVGLASRAVASAKELDDFITNYRAANKSVAKLANQLRLFAVSVEQLEKLLDAQPTVSGKLKDTLQSSIKDCDDIIGDLEEHVQKVVSSSDGSKGLAFTGKIRMLWGQNAIGKEEQTLHRQLQTVMLLISLVRENDAGKQNSALREPSLKTTLAKSARDARSIRESKDALSRSNSIRSSSRWSSSGNTEVEFDIDEELLKSGPYVANYRAMVAKSRMNGNRRPSFQVEPTDTTSPPPGHQSISMTSLPERHSKNILSSPPEHVRAAPVPPPPRLRNAVPVFPPHRPLGQSPRPDVQGHNEVPTPAIRRPKAVEQFRTAPTEQPLSRTPMRTLEHLMVDGPRLKDVNEKLLAKKLRTQTSSAASADREAAIKPKKPSRKPSPRGDDSFVKKLMDSSFPAVVPSPPSKTEQAKLVFPDATVVRDSGCIEPQPSDDENLNDLCDACEEGNFQWAKYLLEEETIPINCAGKHANMKSPLHLAVETGGKDMVDLLLEHSASPNIVDGKGHTPLLYAIERILNDDMPLDIARSLADHGARSDCLVGPRPLVAAVSRGHAELVTFLLQLGVAWAGDSENEAGEYIISIAVASGRADFTKLLLEHFVPNIAGSKGRQPLHIATMAGRRDLVQLLMDHGADEKCRDHDGFSPFSYAVARILETNEDLGLARLVIGRETLHLPSGCPLILLAVSAGHIELAKLLIQNGANCEEGWEGKWPLGAAVRNHHLDMVSLLAQEGKVKLDMTDEKKLSPLLHAVRKGHVEIVSALLKTDGKPILDEPESCRLTLLSTACCHGRVEMAKCLLDLGVSVEGWSDEPLQETLPSPHKSKVLLEFGNMAMHRYTALHVAARVSPELTRLLLDANAPASHKTRIVCHGWLTELAMCEAPDEKAEKLTMVDVTPLHLAVGLSAEILITHGKAHVFVKDSCGRTPLFWAAGFIIPGRGRENLQAVEANLAQGSPVNLRDIYGMTPLHLVARAMLICGDIDVAGLEETTWGCPKHLETLRDYISIARALLSAGAKTNIQAKNSTVTVKDEFKKVYEWYLPQALELRDDLEQLNKDLGME